MTTQTGPGVPGTTQTGPSAVARFSTLKVCAWSGPVFVIALGVGLAVVAGFVPPPREHWSTGQVVTFYRDHDVRIKAGMEVLILFAPLYYCWSLAVAHVMERTEGKDSVLVRLQLFGGLSTTWVTAGAGLGWLIAAFRAGHRNPDDVRMFNDVGFLVFNLTAMFTFVQMVAMAVAWLKPDPHDAVVPRWVAYATLWICMTFFVVILVPFVQTGPFAWHGAITFYMELGLFSVWMFVVSWYVIGAMRPA
jgi:hypothetical protein